MEEGRSKNGGAAAVGTLTRRCRGRPSVFTNCQKRVLLRYYEEHDMKSTHRRNEDLMRQAVVEAQTSIERVKRFIGAENARRRRVLLQNTHKGGVELSKGQNMQEEEGAEIARDSNSEAPSENGSC